MLEELKIKNEKRAKKELNFYIKRLANRFIKRNQILEQYDGSVAKIIEKAYISAYRICLHQHNTVRSETKENEQLKQELEKEKQLNAEIKKRLVEVEYDCEEFNHEYCDINCKGKRKELVDLYQLISDGLNETLLKQKDEEIEQLTQEKCELLGIIQKKDKLIKKMKRCGNCKHHLRDCQNSIICVNNNHKDWELAE